MLPAVPRELVYIRLRFLSRLSLAAGGHSIQVSEVRRSRDVKMSGQVVQVCHVLTPTVKTDADSML